MTQTDNLSNQFEFNYQPAAGVSQKNETSQLLLGPHRASLSRFFPGVTAKLAFDEQQSDSYKNLFKLIENQTSVNNTSSATNNHNLHISHQGRSQEKNSSKNIE